VFSLKPLSRSFRRPLNGIVSENSPCRAVQQNVSYLGFIAKSCLSRPRNIECYGAAGISIKFGQKELMPNRTDKKRAPMPNLLNMLVARSLTVNRDKLIDGH
jgi:hypothetical protein